MYNKISKLIQWKFAKENFAPKKDLGKDSTRKISAFNFDFNKTIYHLIGTIYQNTDWLVQNEIFTLVSR